jgi:hypothetical protein
VHGVAAPENTGKRKEMQIREQEKQNPEFTAYHSPAHDAMARCYSVPSRQSRIVDATGYSLR